MFKLNSGYQMKFILFLTLLCAAFLLLSGTAMAVTYEITNEADLATYLLDESKWAEGATFNLSADIDVRNIPGFKPIGSAGKVFSGTLEGNNHTISNLTYSEFGDEYTHLDLGFFGYTEDSVIQNVKFNDINIFGKEASVGAVVGQAERTAFSNIHITNSVINGGYGTYDSGGTGGMVGWLNNSTITNCSFSGDVSGYLMVGGLVGTFYSGSCTLSSSVGTVAGNNETGGFIGALIEGTVTNSSSDAVFSHFDPTNTSAGIGGFLGGMGDASVSDCNSSGYFNGDNIYPLESTVMCGGFAGAIYLGSVSNCKSDVDVSGGEGVGGFVGAMHEGSVSNCSSAGNVSGRYRTGGFAGDSFASLIFDCSSTGSLNVTGVGSYIGGFIGAVWNNSQIQRCFSTGNIDMDGPYQVSNVGGFVGFMEDSAIAECYAVASSIIGSSEVGGFVGNMSGSQSQNSIISECYAVVSSISGEDSVGGFVGDLGEYSIIENTYTEPVSVTASGSNSSGFIGHRLTNIVPATYLIKNSYTSYETFASWTDPDYMEGIVDCFYANATVTNPANVGRLNSVTLADLKKIETFQTEGGYVSASWVITSDSSSSIWYIDEDNDYPRFVPASSSDDSGSDSSSGSGSGQATIVDSRTSRPTVPEDSMNSVPSDEPASDSDSSENSSGGSDGSTDSVKKGSFFLWILLVLGALIVSGWFFFILFKRRNDEENR